MQMKQFLLFITAAVLGGCIALVGFSYVGAQPPSVLASPARLVNQAPKRIVDNPPAFDFKAAARIATPAVVHIAATVRGTNGSPFDLLFESAVTIGTSSRLDDNVNVSYLLA